MADLVRNANGNWIISNLYITGLTDNAKFDVTLKYKGVPFTITGVTKDQYLKNLETPWTTQLGENIRVEDIEYEAAPVYSEDGTKKYIISALTMNSTAYDPTSTSGDSSTDNLYVDGIVPGVPTYKVVIDEIPNLDFSGKTKISATYIVSVDGEEKQRTTITNAIWSSSDSDVVWVDEDGYLNYNNTTGFDTIETITCTYNDVTGKVDVKISSGERKTDTEHTVTLECIVSGGSSEPYPYFDELGILNFVVKYDGENVTSAATWNISNPIAKIWGFATSAPMTWLNTNDTEQVVEVTAAYNGYYSTTYSFRVSAIPDDANGTFVMTPKTEDYGSTLLPSEGKLQFNSFFSLGEIHDNDVTNDTVWSVDNPNVGAIDATGFLGYINNNDASQTITVTGKYTFNGRVYSESTTLTISAKNAKIVNVTFYVDQIEMTTDTEHPYGYVRVPKPNGKDYILQDFDAEGKAEIQGQYQIGSTLLYDVIKKGYHEAQGTYVITDQAENGVKIKLIKDEPETVTIRRELQIVLPATEIHRPAGGQWIVIVLKTFANDELIGQRDVTRGCTITSDSEVFSGTTLAYGKLLIEFNNTNTRAKATLKFKATYEDVEATASFIVANNARYSYVSDLSVYGDRKKYLPSNGYTPGEFAYEYMYYNNSVISTTEATDYVVWSYNDFGSGIVTKTKLDNGWYRAFYNNTTTFDMPLVIEAATKNGALRDGFVYIIPGVNSTINNNAEMATFDYKTGTNMMSAGTTKFSVGITSNTQWKLVTLSSINAVSADIADIDWISPTVTEGEDIVEPFDVNLQPNYTGYERYCYLAIQSKKSNKLLGALYIRQSA